MAYKRVSVASLEPHPSNPNAQAPQVYRKLKANIAATGKYPAVIVRSLDVPTDVAPRYQILDGEHRWKIVKELGHSDVIVDDWGDLPDDLAFKLLLTLNPLRGKDNKRKRASILQILRQYEEADDLARVLPEEAPQIERSIERLTAPVISEERAQDLADDVEPITFLFTHDMRKVVNGAIRIRTAQGELPGDSIDPQRFAGVMSEYQRGRAVADICAQYVLQQTKAE